MVRVLALRLTEDAPFVLLEKKGKTILSLKTGLLSDSNPRLPEKIDFIFAEFGGARFLQSKDFGNLPAPHIHEDLREIVGSSSENSFKLLKVSDTLVATLRESCLSEHLEVLDKFKLAPLLLVPEGFSYYLWLRQREQNGIFSIEGWQYVIQEGKLLYIGKSAPAQLSCRFPGLTEKNLVPEIPGTALPPPPFNSLAVLAAFGKDEKESFNFLEKSQIETTLEPKKMRQSRNMAILLSLPILLVVLQLQLHRHDVQKNTRLIELDYSVSKKRAEKIKAIEKEATANLTSLHKLSPLAGSSSITALLLRITESTPSGIALTGIEEERQTKEGKDAVVLLTGTATEMSTVFEYESALKQAGFSEIKVRDSRKAKSDTRECVLFKISVKP